MQTPPEHRMAVWAAERIWTTAAGWDELSWWYPHSRRGARGWSLEGRGSQDSSAAAIPIPTLWPCPAAARGDAQTQSEAAVCTHVPHQPWHRCGQSRGRGSPDHLHAHLWPRCGSHHGGMGGSTTLRWCSAASTAPAGSKWLLGLVGFVSSSSASYQKPAFVPLLYMQAPRACSQTHCSQAKDVTSKVLWGWARRWKGPKETPDLPNGENELCHCARRHRRV